MASTGDTWRLGRRPALDGLRGVAVLIVVASHLSHPGSWVRQFGMVGVTVFFTLSGFLITAKLLKELTSTGGINFARFYRGRLLRLAPAMVVCVGVVTALGLVLGPSYATGRLALGALTWTANWLLAVGAVGGEALVHTWSLSIEEQFYLLWPAAVLLFARLGRGWLVGACTVGIVASAASRFYFVTSGSDRIYFGSDTRADSLLIGCLVAAFMHGRPERPARPVLAGIMLGGVVMLSTASPAVVFLLIPLLVGLGTAAVIYWTAQGSGAAWLSHPRLTYLGQRSYGLYLWHWPLIVLAARVLGMEHWTLAAVVSLPFAALATWLSWRYIEQPGWSLRGLVDAVLPGGRRHPDRHITEPGVARTALEPDPAA